MIKKLQLIILSLLLTNINFAQLAIDNSVHLPNTIQQNLTSEINNIPYKIYISLPKNYNSSSVKYPVVYLLDADYSFALAKNIVDHLSDRNDLEESIIIGIAYQGENNYRINRTRDYTPTNTDKGGYSEEIQKTYSGGAKEFLSFFESELIPFINSNYRISGKKVIVGHSYGGLFCSWVLLTKPELFDGYIIVSPSIWFDDYYLMQLNTKFQIQDHKRVYLTVGDKEMNSERSMVADLKNFHSKIISENSIKFKILIKIEENQTHNSIFPIGLSNGLRFVLEGR